MLTMVILILPDSSLFSDPPLRVSRDNLRHSQEREGGGRGGGRGTGGGEGGDGDDGGGGAGEYGISTNSLSTLFPRVQ